MRVIKPIALGVQTRAYTRKPKHYLSVGALAGFDLRDPLPLLPETDVLPAILAGFPGQVWDAGMPKVQGEVILAGEARAPGGRPVRALEVGLRVGTVEKHLQVYGDRIWQQADGGFRFTRPEPFTSMPLAWERAFGGSEFPDNPLGIGHGARACHDASGPVRLPNLEDPRHPVLRIDDVPAPSGFGMLDQMWPARRRLMGTYDQHWYDTLFPGYAADIDWRFFNTAPRDQWVSGYFRGDEEITIAGCHEEHAVLHGRLPAIRVRALIHQDRPGGRELVEVGMRAETVFLLPNDLVGVVLYRGVAEVAGSDAEDVAELMLAYEKLADEPRALAYYADVHARRTDPKDGWMYALMQSQLSPAQTAEERAARAAARAEEDARQARLVADQQQFAIEMMRDEHGIPMPSDLEVPDPSPSPVPMPTQADIDALDIDLPAIMAAVDRLQADADREIDALKAQAAEQEEQAWAQVEAYRETFESRFERTLEQDPEQIAKAKAQVRAQALEGALPAGMTETLDPDGLLAGIDDAMARRTQDPDAMKAPRAAPAMSPSVREGFEKSLAASGETVPFDVGAFMDELNGRLGGEDEPAWDPDAAREQVVEAVRQAREALVTARLMSPEPMFPDAPLDPEVAAYLGALVLEKLREGVGFAGRDLAGAWLPGADLSGQDLSGVMLESANLEGANLRGSRLAKAVLTGARLRGANLAGADLAGANLAGVDAEEAVFAGADLTDCLMMKGRFDLADLRDVRLGRANAMEAGFVGAVLDRSTADSANFVRADLVGLRAHAARWRHAMLIEVDLRGADFSGSVLDKVVVYDAKGEGVVMDGASLQGFAALASDFTGLRAVGCRNEADGTGFRGCTLAGADFRDAVLGRIELSEANLQDADFRGASLKSAMLFGTDLRRADCSGADLFDAKLRKANCIQTRFRGANLYRAETTEALFHDTVSEGANLVGTRLASR